MLVAPPIKVAVPIPVEGVFVPVPTAASGGTLLKVHCARVSAEALKVAAARRSRLRMAGFIRLVWMSLVLGWERQTHGTLFR